VLWWVCLFVCLCLSACRSARITRKPHSRTSSITVHVACGCGPILWRCIRYVLPVLWMTSSSTTLCLEVCQVAVSVGRQTTTAFAALGAKSAIYDFPALDWSKNVHYCIVSYIACSTYRRSACSSFCDTMYTNWRRADAGRCLADTVYSCRCWDRGMIRVDTGRRRSPAGWCIRAAAWTPRWVPRNGATCCSSAATV